MNIPHNKLHVVVTGAGGRMGRAVAEICKESPDIRLVGALEHEQSSLLGQDLGTLCGFGPLGVIIKSNFAEIIEKADVVIDFTAPDASVGHVAICQAAKKAIVIGTTGITTEQKSLIQAAAAEIPIVLAPNMSIGVNLCFKLLEIAAQALGDEVDIEILEAHHRHKVDAPSGTAIRMGEVVANVLNRDLSDCAVYGREGITGQRDQKTIGFATVRAGDIVGEHTVMFAGMGERVEITHKATDRKIFARGAVRAARWVHQQSPGLYDMRDVLGLG